MNLQHFCRTCLATSETMFPLFDEDFGIAHDNKFVVELLQMFTETLILPNDNFSHCICSNCFCEMKRAYDLMLKCKRSEKTFQQLTESQVLLKRLKGSINYRDIYSVKNTKGLLEHMPNKSICIKEEIIDDYTITHLVDDETVDVSLDINDFVFADMEEDSGMQVPNAYNETNDPEIGESSNKIIQCPACLDTFGIISVLREHLIEVHTMNNMCIMCDNEYFEDIWTHSEVHIPSNYQCTVCDSEYVLEENLQKHMRIHFQEMYACDSCPMEFETKDLLRIHTLVKHRFKCDICCKKFNTETHLYRHKLTHFSSAGPYKCEICSRKFKRKCFYDNHITSHGDDQYFHCKYCPIKKSTKRALIEHEKHHVRSNLLSCSLCSIEFSDRLQFQKHLMQHRFEDSDNLRCIICSRKFRDKHSLNEHKTIHTGEKPFSCHLCDRKFRLRRNLRAHFISHSSETPYPCMLCSKKFKKRVVLINHIKGQHYGGNNFPCGLCEMNMVDAETLYQHWKDEHPL